MDYHSMKRSELQALCKKHKIPANSANSVLADKLSELLNEKQKPRARQRTCIKSPVDTIDENESAVSRRQSKKVRFSPEVEYEQSGEKQKAVESVVIKGRRKSVAKKVDEPAVDNVNTVTDDDVQIPVKVTRSRANLLGKDDAIPTNERKLGRRAVKIVEKETDAVKVTEGNLEKVTRSKANAVGKGVVQLDKNKQSKNEVKEVEKESEPVKETVVARTRVTRSKAQTVTEDSKDPDLSPQVKKKSGRQTNKDEEKVEPSKEVKDVPVRATRSRLQASHDDSVVANLPAEKKNTRKDDGVVANPPVEKKRTRNDDSVVANPPVEKKRTRRDTMVSDLSHNLGNKDESDKLGRGRHKKSSEEKAAEVSEIQDNADKGTRQSRRNKANVEDSAVPNQNESKLEIVNDRKLTRSKAALAKKPSVGKGKSKAGVETDSKTVQQLEEPFEPASKKNVIRRKSVIQPKLPEVVLPLEEPENVPAKKDTRRKSVVQKVQEKVSKKPLVGKMETIKETELPGSPNVRTRKTVEKMQAKDASENDTETVASGSGSHKTRKRRGDPIIEDHTIEAEPVSTLKDSAVKKDQGSGVKTPASGKGVISGDTRSKKRAKSSEIKQSDAVDHAEKANTTPSSKMANLEIDDKVIETEQTPAIAESGRRFTRSAIRSDRKEPSQSAIKEQNTGAALLSSRKLRGRPTCSGIKIDEKNQSSESAYKSQPLIDAEMASPEDAEAKSSTDEAIAVPFEVSKEANSQILEQSGDLSAPESVRSPTIDAHSDGVQVVVNSEKSAILEVLEKETEVTEPNTMGTPILKMANLEIDDKIETEQIPTIAESGRRFTRGAIRSDRKEPSQSAIKEQNTRGAFLSSRKPRGRPAHSGIKIGEKKQPTDLIDSTQPLDAQMASTVAAEAKSAIPDVLEKETELTKSDTMGTPISKMANLELDDKVTETEQIPAIDESGKWFTRSAIRSDRKEPSQSTIKKEKTAAHLSSRKTPGRFTRSGIKVNEKKPLSESTHQSQPLDDAQMVSPDAAEVKPSPDETIVVPSEAPKEANAQILEQSGDLSAPEFVMSPTIDAIADGSHAQNQNQEVHVSSEIVSEAEVQVVVNSEKSAIPEVLEKETDMTKFDTLGTPISKMANLEPDDKVVETEQFPVIDESGRRFTRAIRSNIKEPSQSAIKEQKTRTARFSSRKTPGRFTRSGIEGDEKNQLGESTLQSQPLDDAQMPSPEAAEAKSSPDETLAVSSEAPKEANAQILEQSGDLSAPESVMSPTIDALSDGSHPQDQNQEVHVSSEIVSETEVPEAVNSEKSAIPEVSEKETELTKSGSTSEGLENDVMVEEMFVSVVETVVIEEGAGISYEQSVITGKSKEEIDDPQPSIAEGLSQLFADDEDDTEVEDDDEDKKASNQKHEDVADKVDAQEMDAVKEGDDVELNREETQELSSGDDRLQGLGMDENDAEDEKVTILPESLTTHSEPEKEFVVVEAEKEPATVTESSPAHSEPAMELESDVVPSTRNDVHEIPILGNSDEDEGADDVKEHESNTNDEDGKAEQEQQTGHYSFAKEDQDVEDVEPEPVQSEDVPVLPEVSNSFSDHEQEPSQNEDVPELPEVSIKSPDQESEPAVSLAVDEAPCDTVDASTSKDSPQSPAVRVDALEEFIDGLENEEKAIGTSEFGEGVQSKESESVPLDMSNEGRTEEAELASANDHALVDEKEQTDNDMEDYPNHGVAQENPTMEESSPIEYTKEESTVDGLATDQLPGDLGAYGSPTTEEESPIDDTVSDPPTAFKNEDIINQDWDFATDDFQKPVSANQSDDVGAPSTDGQASSLQTCSPAVANESEDFFNWSVDETEGNATRYPDSSLKTLFKTPAAATTQVSFAKDTQETKVKFSLLEEDNTAQVSHVKDREQSTVRFAFPDEDDTEVDTTQIPDSSLKRLFTTPATALVSDIKHRQESSTVRFALPHEDNTEGSASLKSLFATPSTARATHVNNSEQSTCSFGLPFDSFDQDENQDNASSQHEDGKNESFGVMTFEEFSHKYFDDEEGEDASGGKDQIDEMEQHDLSSEAAGKSHHDAKDKSVYNDDVFVKNEESQQPKDSETGDEDSALNALFKTAGTTTISHVEAHQQSAVSFTFPEDCLDKSGERTQNPGLIEDPKMTFEDFAHKYFDDAKDDGQFEFKNDQEASGTSHLKGSETGEEGSREM